MYIPEPRSDKKTPHVPEFVRNVMGSSAGAGSGEFHVYRHLRRKEYARQKHIQLKADKVIYYDILYSSSQAKHTIKVHKNFSVFFLFLPKKISFLHHIIHVSHAHITMEHKYSSFDKNIFSIV